MRKTITESKTIGGILQSKAIPGKSKGRKRRKMVFYMILALLIISIISVFIIDYIVEKTGRKHLVTIAGATSGYDCIIVPGAMVYGNSTPSAMLADRLDVALKIYNLKLVNKIIVSGDHGTKEYDEVNTMRTYLISRGVASEDVFMDHAGFDTYQTIFRARDVFKVRKALITTQGYHLYRALYIGEKLGVEMYGIDSALRDYNNTFKNRFREYFARTKAFIECEITKPEPEFMGEIIPIDGDGNQTVD